MATSTDSRRRGLPRIAGGEPWPATGLLPGEGGSVSAAASAPSAASSSAAASNTVSSAAPELVESVAPARAAAPGGDAPEAAFAAVPAGAVVRSGLPRTPGGEPWPPHGVSASAAASTAVGAHAVVAPTEAAVAAAPAEAPPATAATPRAETAAPIDVAAAPVAAVAPAATVAESDAPLRRGLPRISGGDPWPPAGFAPGSAVPAVSVPVVRAAPIAPATPEPDSAAATAPAPAKPAREPVMIGSRSLARWVRLGVLVVVGAVVAAGIIVLAARGVTTLPGVPEFLERYPGEYRLPAFVADGFPVWARWTHYLNFFFMVLIIRSGLLVRHQQKPPAFYTPKRGGKKVSIWLWVHTSLDVLWLVNGVVFVVLLFATGHWARVVPTSWEVFPNAISALLQYLTLEWPVENGWVNYNSLQQLMYFLVVFVAAPVAAITGVRMSGWWPKDHPKLDRVYPAPVARAIHFPTMLFFCLFILIHVFLVFSTGMRRNLNHMFAGNDQVSWVGFWWFAAGLAVVVAAWIAARPFVLAQIAGVTGKVSER